VSALPSSAAAASTPPRKVHQTFTGLTPKPAIDELERRAVVLLEEVENFRRHHPEVLDRLGIEVEVRFCEDAEQSCDC
jgi:hypothetical protein